MKQLLAAVAVVTVLALPGQRAWTPCVQRRGFEPLEAPELPRCSCRLPIEWTFTRPIHFLVSQPTTQPVSTTSRRNNAFEYARALSVVRAGPGAHPVHSRRRRRPSTRRRPTSRSLTGRARGRAAGRERVSYDRKDAAYRRAKAAGYRARSAYKLIQLDDRFLAARRDDLVADLGAWPGAWMQVAAERVGARGRVVGIDLVAIAAARVSERHLPRRRRARPDGDRGGA